MSPAQMASSVFKINRDSIWDAGIGLGLLKGKKLQQLLEDELPRKVQTFDKCKISFGVTTFSLTQMRTVIHASGALATAMRASACFPGLFTPVVIDDTLHIDGGVFDRTGMMGLTGIPKSGLVVNVVFHLGAASELPPHLTLPNRNSKATILTVVLSNIPQVNPFTMNTAGPAAYRAAKNATLRALTQCCHVQRPAINHYIFYIEAMEQDWRIGEIDGLLKKIKNKDCEDSKKDSSKTKTTTKTSTKSRRGSSAVKHSRVSAKRS
jgi:predicted acylesterase/phospholipase RssA